MFRKVLSWGIPAVALIAVSGYWLVFTPLPRLPELARGLPSNFADAEEEFGRRVNAAFPLPLTVNQLTALLSEQGFSIQTQNNLAVFEMPGFPCAFIWRVHWEAEDKLVSALTSMHSGNCL